jgi:hypothetical protein
MHRVSPGGELQRDSVYPVVFIDRLVAEIRAAKPRTDPSYAAIGVALDGKRDILGLWVGGGGAKYWLQVLSEIKNRGVEDSARPTIQNRNCATGRRGGLRRRSIGAARYHSQVLEPRRIGPL